MGIEKSVKPKDLVNFILHLSHKGQSIPSVQENKSFENKEKILLNEQSQGFIENLKDRFALLGSSYLKEAAVWYQICLLHDTYEPNTNNIQTTEGKVVKHLKYMYSGASSEEDQLDTVDVEDEAEESSVEDDAEGAQEPKPKEQQAASSKSKPKPPSPTDFKGKLENAARELEKSLSLIVNRQEQSEEPNIVLARNLYASASDKQKEALQKDDLDDSETIDKLLYGGKDTGPVDNALLKSFNSIITADLQELKIKLEKDLEPDQLYTDIFNNKVPKSLEAAITAAATESAGSDEDQSTYIESLDEFKKRVNETCQRFNKVLKTVNIGSSSTQRNLVLKNKPILNFVARKIREEEKSYEDFFKELLQGKDAEQLATILKYFSFSPMFDFDGKLINSLSENFQRYVKEREFKDLIFYVLRSNLNQEPTPIEKIMKDVLGSLFPNNKSKVQEIISGSQEYKDQCELFYGVEPSEEEAKDSQLEELCKSISRKLLEAQDEKAYNEKRREAQEKYEKEMLDAKKEQVQKEGFRFGVGAAIPLAVSVLGAVATGGLGAVALATAGVLGMPVGALIGHSTVGLKSVQKDEVKKSDLTKDIEDLAKKNLKVLDASIIEALKNAKIVEGIYVHERSLAELLFELKDFDVIGKKSRKKEIKKREIKRKDFEDILTRNKVLMYDSKYASFPADISAVKNEFIESLNLLLSYYYNATIENVKQATSSAEVRAASVRTAVSNRVEAAKDTLGDNAGQQFVEEFKQTTDQYDIPLDDEFNLDSFIDLDADNLRFDFSSSDFESDDTRSSHVEPAFTAEEPRAENLPPAITDEPESQDNDKLKLNNFFKKYDIFNTYQNFVTPLISENNVFTRKYAKNKDLPLDDIESASIFPKVTFIIATKSNTEYSDSEPLIALIGVVYDSFLYYYKSIEEKEYTSARSGLGEVKIINDYLNNFKTTVRYLLRFEDVSDSPEFLNKIIELSFPKDILPLYLKKTNSDEFIFESKLKKNSDNYILGSLTNLLFESSNKEDLSVIKRVYNKNDSVNSSSLEKEWRRLWNIYK